MKLTNLVFFLLLSLFAATSAKGLTAGFTIVPPTSASGCAPLLVSFHNTTTPAGGTTYSWTFGTSGVSSLTDPSAYFTTPGTHLVTLTATNGTSVSTFTMTITVYPPPTVSFVADDTVVCPGTPITFTSTTLGGVPGTVTCTWNWGDGSATTVGSPAVHTYTSPGFYTVSLFATNSRGCQASLVKTTYIQVVNNPVASIISAGGACNPPATIAFSSGSSGTPPLTYSWTFGDGGTGVGASPPHTYATTGTYTVNMVVTDANGCTATATQVVTIGTITAAFTYTTTACVFTPVTFTNTSTPHTGDTWDFGDGSSSTAVNGVHAYSAPGTYTVKLTIVNGPCTSVVTHVITILAGPVADFVISPAIPCPAPATVTHTGSGPAGTIYSWLFSGGSATGNPADYTYTSNGVKTIKMIVVDPTTGCRDTVTKTDTLYDMDYRAFGGPYEGCVPLSVTFGSNLYTHVPTGSLMPYPLPITSYSWDFGDGTSPSTGATPTHVYTAVGVYTATVTAITSNGCTISDVVTIWVGAPPVVTFTATPRHVCYGTHTPIIFSPVIVSGPVDEYHWSFGDGGTIRYDTANPPAAVYHTYSVPGTFDVTVTPYWRGCPGDPYTLTSYIIVDSPKAIIGDSVFCSPRTRVQFWDSSLGDNSHLWMFGDGITSTDDDPIHDYPAIGSYTVTLATYNIASGCRDTARRTVILSGPVPNFTASVTDICRGQSVTFTSTTTSPGYVSAYYWYIDGSIVTTPIFSTTITRNFSLLTDTGYHTVRLVIRNYNGCYDTFTRPNYIHVGSPHVDFTATPITGCAPLNVTFTDATTPVSGTTLLSQSWRFGDGGTASGSTTSHVYNAAGTYTIWHLVTDDLGCIDSFSRSVTVYKPVAAFSVSNLHPCLGAPVTFTNLSGPVATALWDFGDGGTSTTVSPVYTYNTLGVFNVKLTITDSHGCTDDTTYVALIDVSKPNANFTMSDSVSVCPPLFVNFTNLSTGATVYNWTLGDGGISTMFSPANMYVSSGLYNVRLIATSVYGCKDTVQKPINIFGYAGAFTFSPKEGCAPLLVNFVATLANVPFITWDFSDGVTSSTSFSDTMSHIYTTPGAYVPKLVLSDNTGCQTSSTSLDTIKVDGVTAKFITVPNPVCIGIEFTFIDSSTTYWSPITNWDWTYDGNTSTLQNPLYTINTPGTYPVTLKVTNGWGCIGLATGNVVVEPPPVVTASPDTVVCVGDPATLMAYGANTYTWDPPVSLSCISCNPTFASPTTVTTYTVTGTDTRGCIDTAVVTVGLRTHTISRAWGDTAVCRGVPVQIFDTGGTKYFWYTSAGLNNPTIFNPIATPAYTTIYHVVAQLAGCIPDTNEVTVFIYPLPTVDAGPDQKLLAGSSAQLTATGTDIATYTWWPGETLNCTDCYNPVASMSVMTTYNVDVVSPHGCKASDSVTIFLYCDQSQVFIPNAFTPNGDGQNDVFYPRGAGLKYIKTFRVYNRWGELLYQREGISLNDASTGWDGSYKGDSPKPDVYVYIMEAICYTGEEVNLKGDVTILR